MFLDEARLAARIRHPNVVPTLDVVSMSGELFLVMDYVHGEPFSGLLRAARRGEAPVPVDVAAAVVAQALHGLHAAHEAHSDLGEPLGIVHRDVSPQNVIVGIDGNARVLDFGVAKALGRVQTTREGQLKGKLGYLSPEQILGHPVTRASDVFSASVVLWEALAGRRLFAADSEGGVLHRILEGKVEPPSRHAPALAPALDAVVMRGLSVEPADRFDTALAMAEALEQAGTPAPARAPSGSGVRALRDRCPLPRARRRRRRDGELDRAASRFACAEGRRGAHVDPRSRGELGPRGVTVAVRARPPREALVAGAGRDRGRGARRDRRPGRDGRAWWWVGVAPAAPATATAAADHQRPRPRPRPRLRLRLRPRPRVPPPASASAPASAPAPAPSPPLPLGPRALAPPPLPPTPRSLHPRVGPTGAGSPRPSRRAGPDSRRRSRRRATTGTSPRGPAARRRSERASRSTRRRRT